MKQKNEHQRLKTRKYYITTKKTHTSFQKPWDAIKSPNLTIHGVEEGAEIQ
jgi:hypothetical protein